MKNVRHASLVTLLLAVSFLLLTSCKENTTPKIVTATVISKEYVESVQMVEINSDGERRDLVVPEEYNITLKYEDIKSTINDQELYDSLDVGNTIKVNLITYYDENGNIRNQVLRKQ